MENSKTITNIKLCDRAEQWCNRRLRLGCKISNCMKNKTHPDECNRMRRELEECIRDKKIEILKEFQLV
jgi:hypothetical protein